MSTPPTLSALIDETWAGHAVDPGGCWQRLAAGAPGLCADAPATDLDALLRCAEHLGLGHLANADALQSLLASVQAQVAAWPALVHPLGRVNAALALYRGEPAELAPLPPAEQVRAYANVALAHAQAGRLPAARQLLEQATDRAAQHAEDHTAGRALAALAHNLAAHLREAPGGVSDASARLMIDAATRSRAAWATAGGWLEVERSDWHLAMCHAAAGQGAEALRHAQATLTACEAHAADEFEFCFAWQAMAWAALAAGDVERARQARNEMAARAILLEDPGFIDYAQRELAQLASRLEHAP